MLLHTFKNEEQQTRVTVHKMTDAANMDYFRVTLVDEDSGQIVGAFNRCLEPVAMLQAKIIAEGKVQPGDSVAVW